MEPKLDTEKHHLLASVANLYYMNNLTQSEIAARLFISRSKVSRLLQEARDLGVVKITIYEPWNRDTKLEECFRKKYALRDIRILNFPDSFSHEEILQKLGDAAAYYLDSIIDSHTVLGISWGYTIYKTVHAIHSQKNIPLTVVPIMGPAIINSPEKDSPNLAKQLAMAYGGKYYYIYAPLFVSSEHLRRELVQDQKIQEVLLLASRANVILTSVGSIQYRSWKDYMSIQEMAEIQNLGGIGHIGGHFYDIHGREIVTKLSKRLIAIDLNSLRNARNTICVAGLPEKAAAILGALNGRLLNTLITDSKTAVKIIQLDAETHNNTEIQA